MKIQLEPGALQRHFHTGASGSMELDDDRRWCGCAGIITGMYFWTDELPVGNGEFD